MIWLKKMMKLKPTTPERIRGWEPNKNKRVTWIDSQYARWTYRTDTNKPKGKQGKIAENLWIEFGQKKFEFRKFGSGKTFDSAENFIKALQKRGFVFLGSGAFSTVLGKENSNRVIKVIRRPDGWIDYIRWASYRGEAGRFAPRVFSYKKIKGKKKDFSVAIMERLEYTFKKTPKDHALKIIPDLMWRANDNPMAASFMDILAPGLKKFMDDLGKEFKGSFDLHSGNLMLRKDGSFVVVDPICDGDKADYKRLKAGDFSPVIPQMIGFKLLAA